MKYVQPELLVVLSASKSIAGHSGTKTGTCNDGQGHETSAGAYEVDE